MKGNDWEEIIQGFEELSTEDTPAYIDMSGDTILIDGYVNLEQLKFLYEKLINED